MSRSRCAALVACGLALVACAAPQKQPTAPVSSEAPVAPAPSTHDVPSLTLARLLSRPPDLVLTLHPPALSRDPVYGPLLRRASELASAFAGPTNLGTTALAVLERTDEVLVAENDRGKEAVVVLRGVPADVDPLQIVDTSGHPVWHASRADVRTLPRELEPAEPADAALFVTPGLVWIVASGPAIASTRAALFGELGKEALVGDDTPLVSLSLPGDAIAQLRQGTLATVGAGLLKVQVELTPGATGLIVSKLTYGDAVAAASAEGTVLAVTLAFRHRLEEDVKAAEAQPDAKGRTALEKARKARPGANLEWLGAAKVERTGTVVVVRAPIPRPWLDALTHADVPAPAL